MIKWNQEHEHILIDSVRKRWHIKHNLHPIGTLKRSSYQTIAENNEHNKSTANYLSMKKKDK